jgi:hypothetical protein
MSVLYRAQRLSLPLERKRVDKMNAYPVCGNKKELQKKSNFEKYKNDLIAESPNARTCYHLVLPISFEAILICRIVLKLLLEVIHEHDFLPMGTNSHFIQCRNCNAVYCTLCGKIIARAENIVDHGFGRCIQSDTHSPTVSLE